MKFNRWVDYINFLVVHCEQQDDLYKKCERPFCFSSIILNVRFIRLLAYSVIGRFEHYDAEDDIAGLFDCTPGLP